MARYGGTVSQARFRRGAGTGGLAGYRSVRFPRPQIHSGPVGGTVVARVPVATKKKKPTTVKTRAPKPVAFVPPQPATPAVDPMFAGWNPADIAAYNQIGAQEKQHEGFITGQVMPWLSGSLNALSAYQQNANQGYLDYLKGAQGYSNIAGAVAPATVAPTAAGGFVTGPNAYQIGPAQQAAIAQGSTATAIGQNQAALAASGLALGGQGLEASLAAYVSGLPALYEQKRLDFRAKVDAFVADQQMKQAQLGLQQQELQFNIAKANQTATETARHNRVNEAIGANRVAQSGVNALVMAGYKQQSLQQQRDLANQRNATTRRGQTLTASNRAKALQVQIHKADVAAAQAQANRDERARQAALNRKASLTRALAVQRAEDRRQAARLAAKGGTAAAGVKSSDVNSAVSSIKSIAVSSSGNNFSGLNDNLDPSPAAGRAADATAFSSAIKQLQSWLNTYKSRVGGAQKALSILRTHSPVGYDYLKYYYEKLRKPPVKIGSLK